MITAAQQILIDKYFSKTLSDAERKAFEELKATDKTFQQHFDAEELLYQSLLYDGLKEQFKNYSQTSENPFTATQETSTQNKSWRRRLGVAASIILIAVFGVLAAERAGLIDFNNFPFFGGDKGLKDKKSIPVDSLQQEEWNDTIPNIWNGQTIDSLMLMNTDEEVNSSLSINLKAASQRMIISTHKTYVLSTGTGLNININKHIWDYAISDESLTDSIELVFREVLKAEELLANGNTGKALKVFKLSFDQIPGLAFNSLYPITISQPLSTDSSKPISLLYGGDGDAVLEWKLVEDHDRALIEAPTKIMDDYQMYTASVALIDSIRRDYMLKGSQYVRKGNETVQIKQSFIKERFQYLIAYQNDPEFYSLVQIAKNQWVTYNAQRQIRVNTSSQEAKMDKLYIVKPGWYAIVQ